MKVFAKLLVVGLLTTALTGWVACGGDDGTTTDNGTPDAIQDNGGTDEGTPEDPGTTDMGPADMGPTDEGPQDMGPQDEGPCVPDCGDRVCGVDPVCGESCGTCAGDTVCDEMQGICVDSCDWENDKPATWGPAGVISALQTPADKATAGATCFDFTGEGTGDSGLVGLAGQVNGPLKDAVEGGDIGILFEFVNVTDFANTAEFQLNGLLGESTADPVVVGGEYTVSEDGYVTETCQPMIYFKGAKIEGGVFSAGPSTFRISLPITEGLVLTVNLRDAQIKGTITEGGADGVVLTGGVLSGVLTKQELETVLNSLQAECDAAPADQKPDYCSYLSVAKTAMALLFDLHQVGDGTYVAKSAENPGDAASVCLTYELAKATVAGFTAAQ